MGNILLILLFLFAAGWTYGIITTGRTTMIVPALILWIIAFFFLANPDISRYHIIWAAPSVLIVETLLELIIRRSFRHENKN
jgi:uncharacterized membrane protein YvlD (DUF360 family)